ncbi:MAG: hypothetical protein A2283_13915 [Lentisphaerae bacterium RIFOXYA12_FULL_48_11]|nr:MAG: hypothetical protein A2283_13915 [Lentisphaerae bacterium RIFOXYA12_FULL_48_11]
MKPDEKYIEAAIAGVRRVVADRLRGTSLGAVADDLVNVAASGKMLRVRLMFRIGFAQGVSMETLTMVAAAVEMLHAASLLHDDVIDGAVLRRAVPSFWVSKGASGAILLGDLLVCQAYKLVNESESGRLMTMLIKLTNEVCDAEVEQELLLKGKPADWPTCVSIARRKTGALFAFAAYAAGGGDSKLSQALLDAGYAAGTAYQLADDILDAYGDEDFAGKTLGSDAVSSKITAASAWRADGVDPLANIGDLLLDSGKKLVAWPDVADAWGEYLEKDLSPVIDSFLVNFNVRMA